MEAAKDEKFQRELEKAKEVLAFAAYLPVTLAHLIIVPTTNEDPQTQPRLKFTRLDGPERECSVLGAAQKHRDGTNTHLK